MFPGMQLPSGKVMYREAIARQYVFNLDNQ